MKDTRIEKDLQEHPAIASEGSGLLHAKRLVGTSEGELAEGVKRDACEGSACEDGPIGV